MRVYLDARDDRLPTHPRAIRDRIDLGDFYKVLAGTSLAVGFPLDGQALRGRGGPCQPDGPGGAPDRRLREREPRRGVHAAQTRLGRAARARRPRRRRSAIPSRSTLSSRRRACAWASCSSTWAARSRPNRCSQRSTRAAAPTTASATWRASLLGRVARAASGGPEDGPLRLNGARPRGLARQPGGAARPRPRPRAGRPGPQRLRWWLVGGYPRPPPCWVRPRGRTPGGSTCFGPVELTRAALERVWARALDP